MNPFDGTGAAADLWASGARSFLDAQRGLFTAMQSAMAQGKPAPGPDFGASNAAEGAFNKAMADAEAMAKGFAETLAGPADGVVAGILAKVFDPRGWLGAAGGGDAAPGGPDLADYEELRSGFTDLAAAWTVLRGRRLDHDTLMLAAWSKAAATFAEAAGARGAGAAPEELTALWLEIADKALRETQRSEPFLVAQRETLKASTDLKLAQGRIGEVWGRLLGQPTRAELDDVHKTLTELRREVRALSRATRQGPTPPPPPPPAPPPKRRRTRAP